MEIKKSPAADLENKKGSFLLIGLVIMLAVVYVTLEWTKTDVIKYDEVAIFGEDENEEMMQVTIQDQTPPPPPPEAVAPPPVITEIQIVDNTVNVEDVPIQSTEADNKTEIVVQPVVVKVEEEEDEVFSFAKIEEKPTFPGGNTEMLKYLATHTNYPTKCAEMGIEGTVAVQFTIGKDGKVTDVKVVRGKDPLLDKEAARVVSSMPAWKPGKQGGKPVKVSYTVPVKFKLQ